MKLKKKLRTQTYYVCVLKLLKERNYTSVIVLNQV